MKRNCLLGEDSQVCQSERSHRVTHAELERGINMFFGGNALRKVEISAEVEEKEGRGAHRLESDNGLVDEGHQKAVGDESWRW